MISDFEGGKISLNVVGSRGGAWYSYNDETGTQTPAPAATVTPDAAAGGACSTSYALRTTGTTFTSWGAGVGTGLVPSVAGKKVPYSAAAYMGISFQARASAKMSVRFSVADVNTSPDAAKCTKCDDRHGKTISLGTTWQRYTIPFTAMRQDGWGDPQAVFDRAQIYAIQFQISTNQPAFDMWIDEVAFYKTAPAQDAAVPADPADAGVQ